MLPTEMLTYHSQRDQSVLPAAAFDLRRQEDPKSIGGLPDQGDRAVYRDKGPQVAYLNSMLWGSDVRETALGKFVGDNLVTFWLEHLAHQEYAGRSELLYLHPGAMYLLLHEPVDDLLDAFTPLEVPTRQMIFVPLSSDLHPAPERPPGFKGGAHRSLLVWVRREDRFYHYDSGKGAPNSDSALRVATKLWAMMLRLQFRDKGTPMPGLATPRFQHQTRECESGVYALFLTNLLSLAGSTVDVAPLATPLAIFKYRAHMSEVVFQMIEEYNQLKGLSLLGAKPTAATIMKGGKMAGVPKAEDLESVAGELEDLSEEEEGLQEFYVQAIKAMGEGQPEPEAPLHFPPLNTEEMVGGGGGRGSSSGGGSSSALGAMSGGGGGGRG